ncbi:MAG: hypothetical protein KAG66_19605, partial [Methylococcales bacterium]|nr:hypothetical protein [Methylococcales bacterium]
LTGSLDTGDEGKFWYNSDTDSLRYWNGTGASTLGVSGAGLQSLSGDTTNAQTLSIANGAGVLAPAWNHNGTGDHELRLPLASAAGVTHGLISKTDFDNFNSKQSSALTDGQILIGNGTNIATGRTPSGDLSMSNLGVFTLGTTGVAGGTYTSVTVDTKGRVTAASSPTTLAGYGITDAVADAGDTPSIQAGLAASIPVAGTVGRLYVATDTLKIYRDTGSVWDVVATTDAGDITSGTLNSARLPNSGVTASTYKSVTVDAKGRVTAGSNPASLSGYGITDAVENAGDTPSIQAGANASKPGAGTAGRLYITTDTQEIYRDNGGAWVLIASVTAAGGSVNTVGATTPLSNAGTASDPVIALTGRVPLANCADNDVTAGYPLLSGEAGSDAAYGQLDLTSGVTGTLP